MNFAVNRLPDDLERQNLHDEARFGNAIMLYNFSMWGCLIQRNPVPMIQPRRKSLVFAK